jgi:hypothetical protein
MTTPVEVHIVVVHACPGFSALPAPTVRLLLTRCSAPISIQQSCRALVWEAVDGKANCMPG